MRRWISILLLVMMPLQLGWAALGSFCQHESGEQAQHLGHHAHQHDDAQHEDSAHAEGAAYADCNSCIAGSLVPLGTSLLLPTLPSADLFVSREPQPLFRPSSPPERPVIRPLA